MTDNMPKNITEMAHIIENSLFPEDKYTCLADCRDCFANAGCSAYRSANHLAASNYGNLDAEGKRVAQEIFQRLFDIVREQAKHPMSTPVDWVGAVEYLAKEYDVEVH